MSEQAGAHLFYMIYEELVEECFVTVLESTHEKILGHSHVRLCEALCGQQHVAIRATCLFLDCKCAGRDKATNAQAILLARCKPGALSWDKERKKERERECVCVCV